MKKRMISALLITAMAVSCLFGCAGSESSGGGSEEKTEESATEGAATDTPDNLVIPMSSTAASLNLLIEGSTLQGEMMLAPFTDQLFYKGSDETRYYLAESCEISEDGLVYTLKLRDGVKWHDGEAVTADDVIFTMGCVADTDNGTNYSGAAYINSTEAVKYEKTDDLTVKFTLPEASASYESVLGKLVLIPEHIYKGNTDIKSAKQNMLDIGNGPYKLVEFKPGESVVFEKFEDYYGNQPEIPTVAFRAIEDPAAQEVAFENGEVNLMELSDAQAVKKYSDNDAYTVHVYKGGRTNYLGWNNFSDVWKDSKNVEGLFAALDVNEIVASVYGEEMAEPAGSILSSTNMYYDDSIKPYECDPEKAKALFKETGLKSLKIVYNIDRAYMKETALVVQQQLKNAGIDVQVEGVESSLFFEKIFGEAADYDMYLNGYDTAVDPDTYVKGMYDGSFPKNVSVPDKMLELLKTESTMTDEDERAAAFKEIQKLAYENKVVYPIAYPNFIFVSLKALDGADTYAHKPFYEDYSILNYK